MASFLYTTANVIHASRLPPGTTRTQVLSMLSDNAFFLSCDPHYEKSELIPPAEYSSLKTPPSIPDDVRSQLRGGNGSSGEGTQQEEVAEGEQKAEQETEKEALPTCYRVTDLLHAMPAGLWDSHVESTYEFTDIRDGLFVRIRSPMSVILDTFWKVKEVKGDGDKDGGGLELVEDVTIRCSRLLVGLVKTQCEENWAKIHAKMIARLEQEVKGGIKDSTYGSVERSE